MPEQDFQINVRQVTVGDALKQAEQQMQSVKAASASMGEEGQAAAEKVSVSHEAMSRKIHSGHQILQGGMRALHGEMSGFSEMAHGVANMVGGSFASLALKVSAVGAAFAAGWAAGTVIFEALWAKIVKVGDQTGSLASQFEKVKKQLEDLDNQKLEKLKSALKDIAKQHGDLLKDMGLQQNREQVMMSARHEAEAAQVEAMDDGPAKTRAQAEMKARQAEEKAQLEISHSRQKQEEAAKRKQDYEAQLASLDKNIADAQANADRAVAHVDTVRAAGGDAGAAAKAARIAREAVDRAEKTKSEQAPEIQDKIKDLNREMFAAETDASKVPFAQRTAKLQQQAGLKHADQQQRDIDARESAKVEAERIAKAEAESKAAIEAKKQEEEQALAAEEAQQGGLDSAAQTARSRAESFRVDPRLKGKNRATAQAKDNELDLIAESAAKDAADHKAAIKKIQEAYKESIDALVKAAQDMKTQNKRIGTGQ